MMGADLLCCCGSTAKCFMGVSSHLLQLPELVQCRCCCAIRGDGFNLIVKNYNCFFLFSSHRDLHELFLPKNSYAWFKISVIRAIALFLKKTNFTCLGFCIWQIYVYIIWEKKNITFQGKQQKYTASPQCCSHINDGFCG